MIGQATIGRQDVPLRKAAQRRRIRTVIQNIILCAEKLGLHARQYRIRYGRGNRWGRVTGQLFLKPTPQAWQPGVSLQKATILVTLPCRS